MQACVKYQIGNLTRVQYDRYLHSKFGFRNKLVNETRMLMRNVGVPMDRLNYDAEEWCHHVIDFLNYEYRNNHVFKVYIFGTSG
jgi:hypothetical protein